MTHAAVAHSVIVAIDAVTLILLATTVLGIALVVRSARRRYRAMRARFGLRLLTARSAALPTIAASFSATVGRPAWWATQHERHRLWRAVAGADQAVAAAGRAHAPVGELPMLLRQLRRAAADADAALCASGTSDRAATDARSHVRRVQQAAAEIRAAAAQSAGVVADAESHDLLSAVRLEVAALAAGRASYAGRMVSRNP